MKISVVLMAILVSSCAGKWKPSPVREAKPKILRGWNYVESEKEFLDQESGTAQVSYSGPEISSEKLIFGSERFGIVVLSKHSGIVLWKKPLRKGVTAQPFVTQNKLFVGTELGKLYLYELNSGRETWVVDLGAPVQGTMLMAQDRLFVGTADEALHAVDPGTGKVLWTYRRPAFGGTSIRGGGNPAWISGKIWMGFSDGSLVSLNAQDGSVDSEKQYRDNLKFMDLDARVIGWKDGLLVATYDGKLRYLKRDGGALWEFPAGGARAPLLTEGEIIYFPSSDGNVYAISGTSGKEIWRFMVRRGVPTGIALMEQRGRKVLAVAGSEQSVYVVDAAEGKLVAQASLGQGSGSYAPIAVDQESHSFFVLSNYSRIYQFKLNL